MTICIAAICDEGKSVVVASDKMVTANFLALEFEHPGSKVEYLTPTCFALSAGDALAGTELFRSCRALVNQLNAPTIEIIVNEVTNQFSNLRRMRAEEKILTPRGLSLKSFYIDGLMGKLHPEMAFGIDREITQFRFPIELIVTGVDSSGAHIYSISDPGSAEVYDKLGYHAIGSGQRHALYTIIDAEYSSTKGLNEAAYIVYEAKRRAELAPGVGDATQMFIINTDGIQLVHVNELKKLEEIHRKKTAPLVKEFTKDIAELSFIKERKNA